MDRKANEECFWMSRDGYCTEGGRPPRKCTEACDKYEPSMTNTSENKD